MPKSLFSKAVENLESMFFFVGITELFEESLFLLFHMIGIRETLMWRPGLYTYWRPGKDEMSRRIYRKVSALLETDLELYHRNRQVLENMLAEADFGEELIRYKQHARNPYGRLYRELSERFEVAAKTFGFFSHVVESEFRHSQSVIRNIRELSSDFEKTREEQRENQDELQQKNRFDKKIERERVILGDLPELSVQILEVAREHGRVTISEAVKATGASRNTIKDHMKALIEKGHMVLAGVASTVLRRQRRRSGHEISHGLKLLGHTQIQTTACYASFSRTDHGGANGTASGGVGGTKKVF